MCRKLTKVLAIDTSLGGIALAIADCASGELLDRYVCPQPRAAERELARQTQALLCRVGKLNKIVVAVGPGSFTGIRIGIAFAKGLAAGMAGVNLYGLSSLQAFAATLPERWVFLRITAYYGIVATTPIDGGDTMLRGIELKDCACIEGLEASADQCVIAGGWSELATLLQERGVSYRCVDEQQLLAGAVAAMVHSTCKTEAGEVQALYMRQPYVSM